MQSFQVHKNSKTMPRCANRRATSGRRLATLRSCVGLFCNRIKTTLPNIANAMVKHSSTPTSKFQLQLVALMVCLLSSQVLRAEGLPATQPTGYTNGVEFAYYQWSGSLTHVPDISNKVPVSTGIVENINFPLTTEAWLGAPSNLVDRFVSDFSGYIYAPTSTFYSFTLKSDDGSILWIDGEEAVNHDGGHGFTSRSAKIPLSTGLHSFEVRHFDRINNAGLQLSWCWDGTTTEIIPAEYLFHDNGISSDTDGDTLPDWWEEIYGFDPFVADDPTLDADNDGLTTYEEYLYGASPFSGDADSDGMPDAWEVAYGQHPAVPDAMTDYDGDGLCALEEYRAGSDPRLADTDGDGIGDFIEIMELGSNPTATNTVSFGSQAGASVDAEGAYSFTTETPGIFAFSASITQRWVAYGKGEDTPRTTVNHAKFFVDGHYVSYREIPYTVSNDIQVVFYTPVLSAGTHTLNVRLRHPDYRIRAFVSSAAVYPVSGMEPVESVSRHNGIPASSTSSRVSPAFVEGSARFPWLVSSTSCVVKRATADSWYADIPLSPDAPTTLDLSFESVLSTNIVVSWEETNLFDDAEDVVLRRGSLLLFGGAPLEATDGFVTVFTNGIAACEYETGETASLAFDSDGTYEVVAVWSDGENEEVESDTIEVLCMGGTMPDAAPACIVEKPRQWDCPELPHDCFMETDLRTHISHVTNTTWSLLADDTRGDRIVTARICEDGPILDSTRLNPLWAVDSYGDACYIISTNDTKTLCRLFLVQGWASDDVDFRIRPYSSSVTFSDLTIEKWINASTFDADGMIWYDMIKPKTMSSPCHLVHVYQDGVLIGEAVYNNAAQPQELQ